MIGHVMPDGHNVPLQARACGSPTPRGQRGSMAPCQATVASTLWAFPSPPNTCRCTNLLRNARLSHFISYALMHLDVWDWRSMRRRLLTVALPRTALQVDIDQLDQNKAVNKAGGILGKFNPVSDAVSTDSLQPYSEVSRRCAAPCPSRLPEAPAVHQHCTQTLCVSDRRFQERKRACTLCDSPPERCCEHPARRSSACSASGRRS